MGYEHCISCQLDENIVCPRDVDVICKLCGKGFCGGHIGEHLSKVHFVSLKLDYLKKNNSEESEKS